MRISVLELGKHVTLPENVQLLTNVDPEVRIKGNLNGLDSFFCENAEIAFCGSSDSHLALHLVVVLVVLFYFEVSIIVLLTKVTFSESSLWVEVSVSGVPITCIWW